MKNKNLLIFWLFLTCSFVVKAQNVGIGTNNPHHKAIVHLEDSTRGFLPTRMTSAQRDTLTNKPNGLVIYNVTTNCLEFWNGSQWISTCASTAPCLAPPAPAVSSNSPICAGQTLNLTASTITGATYIWTGPNGFYSTNQNPSIPNANTSHSGTYCCKVYVAGCYSTDACVNVSVNSDGIVVAKALFPGSQRGYPSTFLIGDKLYVIQGGNLPTPPTSPLPQCYAYDISNNIWTTVASPPTTRAMRFAFELNDYGYIVGGALPMSNDCFRYNPLTNSWSNCANYPVLIVDGVPRGAVGVGNYGYLFGGYDCGFYNEIRRYDPTSNTWSIINYLEGNPASAGRAAMYVFEINGFIYYGAGGRYDCTSSYSFNTSFKYDPSTNTTTQLNNLPFSGVVFAYCSLNGYGYVWDWQNSKLWKYDPTTDTWTSLCISGLPFIDLMMSYNGKIYMVNTRDPDPNKRRVYEYTP